MIRGDGDKAGAATRGRWSRLGSRAARPRIGARGVTLPEVVMATVVLSIIVGAVCAIYSSAMRSWYLGAAENYAEQKASLAVQRMVPDLQAGMAASSPYQDCIQIQLPAKAWSSTQGAYLNQLAVDAEGRPYLVQGDYVLYYRGDEDGNLSATGDRVWRRAVRGADGAVIKQQVIADHIVNNPDDESGSPKQMFIYWPDMTRLRSVEVTLTVREVFGHRTATKTMNAELALRNN